VRLRADLHEVALRFVALFTQHVLDPFLAAGMPKEKLDSVVERLATTGLTPLNRCPPGPYVRSSGSDSPGG